MTRSERGMLRRATAVMIGLVLVAGFSPNASAGTAQTTLAGSTPAVATPNILDGTVTTIAQVGNTIVAGGTFTQVAPPGQVSPVTTVTSIVAFDATTGAILPFDPQLFRGAGAATVNAVLPGPAPNTVYVGGDFDGGTFGTAGQITSKRLAVLNLTDSTRVGGFTVPSLNNGIVNTLARAGNRLLVGGTFTTIGPAGHVSTHRGLAALSASTGAVDEAFVTAQLTGQHRPGSTAATGATKMAVSPDGHRLAVLGNFTLVGSVGRNQLALFDLTTSAMTLRSDWMTSTYAAQCYQVFDSYVRDVDFAPDSSYFVVAATGGAVDPACDAASRFPTYASSSVSIPPTWISKSGGDSLLSVAVTAVAVYVGGHQRWLNNPLANDAAGGGAVPRPGLGALDPATGLPLPWNPGHHPRGAGVDALLATSSGLWVGSDNDQFGPPGSFTTRMKIGYFPLSTTPMPSHARPLAPGELYLGGSVWAPTGLVRSAYPSGSDHTRRTVGSGGLDWSTVRGAFLLGGVLYYGKSDGSFNRRTFDGATLGTATVIDPYNDPAWSGQTTGSVTSPGTYAGLKPSFYNDIPSIIAMFYDRNRIYYMRSGNTALYSVLFEPDSGIVGAVRNQSGTLAAPTRGAFAVGATLYWINASTGAMVTQGWVNGAPTGSPAATDSAGHDWRAAASFVGPDPTSSNPGDRGPRPLPSGLPTPRP